ncbi:MAG: cytidine deaminase [Eubacteriales bacterium]
MREYAEIISKSIEAKESAYVPYSHFRVGSAVLTEDDKIYTGCNIENASFGATNCAERTAIFKAISEGTKKIKAIAISTDRKEFIYPCGICRQVIREFGEEVDIVLVDKEGNTIRTSIKELFPQSFSKEDLKGVETDEQL